MCSVLRIGGYLDSYIIARIFVWIVILSQVVLGRASPNILICHWK